MLVVLHVKIKLYLIFYSGIQLSCSHNICIACIPKQPTDQNRFQYQCQTCLTNHQINLTQKSMTNRGRMRQIYKISTYKTQFFSEAQCIFCWSCHQAITLNDYIKGRHRDHHVQTYEEAIPSIKNLLLQQLQKSFSLKEYLIENREILEKNLLRRNYEETINRINQFFHKQMQIIENKRQKIIEEVQKSYVTSVRQVEKQVNILSPLIEEIQNLETKVSDFIKDQIPITEIDPISGILQAIESYTETLRQMKFSVPEFPQFIAKQSINESIENACLLFINNPKVENNLKKVCIKRPNLKQQFYGAQKGVTTEKQWRTNSRMNLNDEPQQTISRKVRLVEKVKGKMNYTFSICSTAMS